MTNELDKKVLHHLYRLYLKNPKKQCIDDWAHENGIIGDKQLYFIGVNLNAYNLVRRDPLGKLGFLGNISIKGIELVNPRYFARATEIVFSKIKDTEPYDLLEILEKPDKQLHFGHAFDISLYLREKGLATIPHSRPDLCLIKATAKGLRYLKTPSSP